MAKKIIREAYTFNPATRTITITGRSLRREQLVLITNVTTNVVIYNFADTSLTASSYTVTTTNNVETTTIVLTYNTGSMSSTDKLAILIEDTNEWLYPAEAYKDPVEKMRISAPQALIDTDFEYGTQPTKWETIALVANRPASFYDYTQPITNVNTQYSINGGAVGNYQITNVVGNGNYSVTISINNTTGITTSTPIFVQDTTDANINGWWIPTSISANTSITYNTERQITNGSVFDSAKTIVFVGAFYTGAAFPHATNAFTNVGSIVTVTTTHAHNMNAGQAIFVTGTSATTNAPNGTWVIRRILSSNSFDFDVAPQASAPTGAITATLNGSLYSKTWGNSSHRAFDGGVTFTAGLPYHGNQLIRQTRRYFRYQSGKGIQFSTGSNLCAPFQTDQLSASGTTVTVTTKYPHNINIGCVVQVAGADQAAYNGSFTVTSIPTETTFTYTALSAPTPTVATSMTANGFTVQPKNWYGASCRLGMFDQQNGLFFEYDGQTLYAVRRSSTTQIPGFLTSLANGSQVCTGSAACKWAENLIPGDYVVIRGMSYMVVSIESNTSMTIYPDFRGPSITSPSTVIISKTIDFKVPQSSWNIDKCDGTGESLFTLDITKMQMFFIDYAWYGAGTVRFGFRNQAGQVMYCHKMAHGNQQTEAYMRSGNLPARYEVNTLYPKTIMDPTTSITAVSNSIVVRDTTGFPNTGTFVIQAAGNTGAAVEYVNYTSKTSTSFSGLVRGIQSLSGPGAQANMGGGAASSFTPTATAPVGIQYWGPQAAVTISHWGSSVIMDGAYDDDRAILFNYGINTPYTLTTAGVRYPIFSIRLGPSVDFGATGTLGQREVINRMQLQPHGVGVFAAGSTIRVELWLNTAVSGSSTFVGVGGSSLTQRADHTNTQVISGGESIATFFAPVGSFSVLDLTKARDIGNSILGGGITNTYPTGVNNKYPDGPDILTVVCIPTSNGATALVRMNWIEAQA